MDKGIIINHEEHNLGDTERRAKVKLRAREVRRQIIREKVAKVMQDKRDRLENKEVWE